MEVLEIKRQFNYKGQILPDIGSEYTPEEIIEHYSAVMPELACGFIKRKELKESIQIFEIDSNFSGKA